MNRLLYIFLFLLFLPCLPCLSAGKDETWEEWLQDVAPDLGMEDEGTVLPVPLEELQRLYEQPLNINTATVDELLQLPFLSAGQVEQIHAYIYLHGALQTMGELRLVPSLDDAACRSLRLFTRPGSKEQDRKVSRRFRQTLTSQMAVPLYWRRGYMTPPDKGGYRGDALAHSVQYQARIPGNVTAGIRFQKDAGERYYDSFGAYAQVEHYGILKRALVGDFRAGFAEGLVFGGNTWISRSAPSVHTQTGIRPMTGMDEYRFFRGVASMLSFRHGWELSLLASTRKLDATLNEDGEVRTIQTDGIHRTALQQQRRSLLPSHTVGGNLTWTQRGFHLGVTFCGQFFGRTLSPGDAYWQTNYPVGSTFAVGSGAYGYSRYRFSFAGETAYSARSHGVATVNRISWTFCPRATLSVHQRYYAPRFWSFHAAALGPGSEVRNVNGVLVHLRARLCSGVELLSYGDFYYRRWPVYRVRQSSDGQEGMVQLNVSAWKRSGMEFRYRIRRGWESSGPLIHHYARLGWNVDVAPWCALRTTARLHAVAERPGWALQQSMMWRTDKAPLWKGQFSVAYFQTQDYASRVSCTLPSIYRSSTSMSCYGRGFLAAATLRWQSPDTRFMLEARYVFLGYLDRETQSSGMEELFSPCRNDFMVGFRIKL